MISVQLMAGDMSIGADGTVTYIDGNRIYAFGHRFLSVGATALPFARAEVLTLLPTLSSSFKISAAREMDGHHLAGPQHGDFRTNWASAAAMVPVSIRRRCAAASPWIRTRMRMVNDRLLSPLLVQMAVFSAIDATERTVGAATFGVTGRDRIGRVGGAHQTE